MNEALCAVAREAKGLELGLIVHQRLEAPGNSTFGATFLKIQLYSQRTGLAQLPDLPTTTGRISA